MLETMKAPLVLSEITSLWNGYMSDVSAIHVFKYFLNNVDGEDTRKILQHSLNLSEQHINIMKQMMEKEDIAIPTGFTSEDVTIDAPRLFTDTYYLFYLNNVASFGAEAYALILRYTARSDLREYFSKCLIESNDLYNRVVDIQLAKGLLERVPRAEVEKKPVFPKDDSLLKGILIDNPRPMFAREVVNTFGGSLMDELIKATTTGFGQVAKTQSIREYMLKGNDIYSRHFQGFNSRLSKEGLPTSSGYDSYVTDSTTAPFSDKLMMFLVQQLSNFGLVVDGSATTFSLRSDLTALHIKYEIEIAKYLRDGLKIMIKNGWFEQPPQVIKHERL